MDAHWHPLDRKHQLEKSLQEVFLTWGRERAGHEVAGVPGWLEALGNSRSQKAIAADGYSFIPDVLWPDAGLVMELKSAAKYEPQALAEVLHHARALERTRGGRYTPAMVTSYNTWLRLSLDFLRSRSLPADSIRYLEVDQLELTGSTRRFLWFDAPLAPWRPAGQIPPCIAEVVPSYAAWYYAEETGSWIGVDRPRPERPLFIEGRYAMLTPISGPGEKFLFWRGGEAKDAGKPDEFWLRDVSLPDGRLL